MANIKQIYTVVNSIAEQSLGMEGLTPTDVSFVSVGQAVLSSDTNMESFYKTLVDRIGKTVVSIKSYSGMGAELKKEGFEFGAILQKLNVKMPTAVKNPSWDSVTDEAFNPFTKSGVTVRQKFFKTISTWEVDGTIPDVQLKTAFTNAQAMAAFIDAIFVAMNNSLEVSYQNTANLCRASFIAKKSKNENGNTFINLLKDYNTATNAGLTVESAMRNTDFLKYAARTINLYVNRLKVMSVLFNDDEYERFTPEDAQVLTVLSDFASCMDFYLQADTYHNNIVALKGYTETPYWQGSGKKFAFEDTSSINVKLEGEEEETKVSGVVAILYDNEAMGVTVYNRRTKSIYNPKGEYNNYFMKADIGFYNDFSENGIVFYIAEN